MEELKKNKRIIIGGFLLFLSVMGLPCNCTSLYIIPVTKSLGISRAQYSICTSAMSVANIVFALNCNKLYRHIDPVKVMKIAVLVSSANCFLTSFINSYPLLILSYFIFGMCSAMCCTIPMSLLSAEWIPGKNGAAMGIIAMGSAVGGTIANPLISHFISTNSWQYSYRVLSILEASISIFAAYVLVKRKPAEPRPEAAAQIKAEGGVPSRKPSITEPVAMRLAISSIMIYLGSTGVYSALTPYLQDIGYSQTLAANCAAAAQAVLAVGKIIYGVLLDRFGLDKCIYISIGSNILGLSMMVFFRSLYQIPLIFSANLLSAPFGTVAMSEMALKAAGGREEDKAAYMGKFSAISGANGIIAPIVMGTVYDTTGSYVPFLAGSVIIMLVFVAYTVLSSFRKKA